MSLRFHCIGCPFIPGHKPIRSERVRDTRPEGGHMVEAVAMSYENMVQVVNVGGVGVVRFWRFQTHVPDTFGAYGFVSRNERTPYAVKPQRHTRIEHPQKFETFFPHSKYLSLRPLRECIRIPCIWQVVHGVTTRNACNDKYLECEKNVSNFWGYKNRVSLCGFTA